MCIYIRLFEYPMSCLAMLKAVDELVSWDSHHRVDPSSPRSSRHSFRDFVGVRTQVTDCNTVKLFIPCNRDELVPHWFVKLVS